MIDDLCQLLLIAARVIERQARVLSMHGIEADPAANEAVNSIRDAVGPGVDENRCVCCGAIIPEGRQICPICERRARP